MKVMLLLIILTNLAACFESTSWKAILCKALTDFWISLLCLQLNQAFHAAYCRCLTIERLADSAEFVELSELFHLFVAGLVPTTCFLPLVFNFYFHFRFVIFHFYYNAFVIFVFFDHVRWLRQRGCVKLLWFRHSLVSAAAGAGHGQWSDSRPLSTHASSRKRCSPFSFSIHSARLSQANQLFIMIRFQFRAGGSLVRAEEPSWRGRSDRLCDSVVRTVDNGNAPLDRRACRRRTTPFVERMTISRFRYHAGWTDAGWRGTTAGSSCWTHLMVSCFVGDPDGSVCAGYESGCWCWWFWIAAGGSILKTELHNIFTITLVAGGRWVFFSI